METGAFSPSDQLIFRSFPSQLCDKIPFLLRYFADAETGLFEELHICKSTISDSKLWKLFQRNVRRQRFFMRNMNIEPSGVLSFRLWIEIGMVLVEGRLLRRSSELVHEILQRLASIITINRSLFYNLHYTSYTRCFAVRVIEER